MGPGGAPPIRRKGWVLGARKAASARITELSGFKWLEAAGSTAKAPKVKDELVLFLSRCSGSAQSLTN